MTKQERIGKLKARFIEMTAHEEELRTQGFRYIAGIDEVGRGPLAGPVYAACVVLPTELPEGFDELGIDDSKKLSEKKREELNKIIRDVAFAVGIGIADNKEIDELNILNATKLAMKRAYKAAAEKIKSYNELGDPGSEAEAKEAKIDMILIDAMTVDDILVRQEAIVKGDANSLSIAAASIVAKVARDTHMRELDDRYPGYDFASNKGYGTAAHYEGIRRHGTTPIHRMTFLKNFDEKHADRAQGDISVSYGGYGDGGVRGTEGSDKGKKMPNQKAKKIYAVKSGKVTGIFETWDECRASVDGFKGAEYKSFTSMDDAWEYLGIDTGKHRDVPGAGEVYAYVDGSYEEISGRYSCGAVMLSSGKDGSLKESTFAEVFDDSSAAELRNVAGEIMGARRAIEYAINNGFKYIRVYHDYSGIGAWGDDKWKANLDMTRSYKDFVKAARGKIKIEFVKVKGHSGNKYNEMADKLAGAALSNS